MLSLTRERACQKPARHFFSSYCVHNHPTEEGTNIRQEDLHEAARPPDLST